ncbi:hypothetical protein VTK73DRAFT_2349 [Phialemonium thermophilum]|uniref:Bulb-type lectin domain-containing protein n=1 Tax=Phialemonium thermophilum TaxID=223376 RepID=A0ABR3VSA3_9PEZI
MTCQPQVQASFADNEELIVYRPGVTGPLDLQPEFSSVPNNASIWLCLSHPLPSSKTFAAGQLSVNAHTSTVVDLHGFHVQIQGDGNLVGLDTTGPEWVVKWASGPQSNDCGDDGSLCVVSFTADGDLVDQDGQGRLWHSATAGQGKTVTFSNAPPYLQVTDASGQALWTIEDGVVRN